MDSRPSRGNSILPPPGFNLSKGSCQMSNLLNCKIINLCHFKQLNWWQSVMAEMEINIVDKLFHFT